MLRPPHRLRVLILVLALLGMSGVWQHAAGTGVFEDSGQELGNLSSTDVALGDVDSDGDLDALVTNNPDASTQVWLNQGGVQGGIPGVFVDSGQMLGPASGQSVALGDLDGDGDLDAFVVLNALDDSNQVWLNQGGVQAGTPGVFQFNGQTIGDDLSSAVALGDIDGDGDLDAFITRNIHRPDKVWLNDGSGQFSDSGQTLGSDSGSDVALADLDGDGDLDAFVANGMANKVWLNQGGLQEGTPGVFEDSGQSLGSVLSQALALGDVDGDGDLDAFVANSVANTVWLNQGAVQEGMPGVFVDSGQRLGTVASRDVALLDLDGDGDLDAFVAEGSGNTVWLNQGGAQGGTPGVFMDSGQSLGASFSEGVALGDVDADGDVDAFIANFGTPNRVWLNQAPAPPVNPEGWQTQLVDGRGITGRHTSLAVDANGLPHISYVRYAPLRSGNNYQLLYTRWDGVRWLTEVVELAQFIGGDNASDGQTATTALALDARGRPHLAYRTGEDNITANLKYAVRDDGEWQIQTVDDSEDVGQHISLALDSTDTPHISYLTDAGELAYAFWDGAVWRFETVDPTAGKFNSLALDSANIPHISYYGGIDQGLKYARRDSAGWQLETVDNLPIPSDGGPSENGQFTSLALDASGRPHVSYIGHGDLRYARRDGTGWQLETVGDSLRNDHAFTSLALDSNGTPHISYGLADATVLAYAVRDDGVWRTEALDNSSNVGRFNSLAVDANDTPHISYYDAVYSDLRYITRAPNWQIQTVDASGTVQTPSLQVRNATPSVAYYNLSSGLVQLATWDAGWNIDPVAFVSNPVPQVSLALGSNLTHLSFYDADNRRLLYATRQQEAFTTQVIDEGGDVGQFNDILLVANADNAVHIAYWDATNLRVKLARFDGLTPTPQLFANTVGPVLNADSGRLTATVLPGGAIGISYYNAVNGDLRLAIWEPQSGAWTDELVDGQSADVGRFNALQTDGTDGSPVVAYYDVTNQTIKYAYRHDGGWQIEVAVARAGAVTSLALELGLNSRLRPRLAFTAGRALHVATRRDGVWQVETVADSATPVREVSLALDTRPHLAYTNGGLRYASRTATLDVNLTVTTAPDPSSGANPLDPCIALLSFFFDDAAAESQGLARQALEGVAGEGITGMLDDQAVFTSLRSLFAASAGGQFFIDLYRQHGSEMGRLGLNDPQLLWDAYGTLQNFLPGLEALVTGQGAEVMVTQEMVDDAFDIWTRLAAAGSPALAEAINTQLAATNNLQDFVGMSFESWTDALGVTPLPCNGDVDGNRLVTPTDALLDLQCFLGRPACTTRVRGRARSQGDITQDGQITATDAQCVLQHFLGLPVASSCECFLE